MFGRFEVLVACEKPMLCKLNRRTVKMKKILTDDRSPGMRDTLWRWNHARLSKHGKHPFDGAW
jgi:hypothetical protein